MKNSHYSEQDIQDYVNGQYAGDMTAFAEALQQDQRLQNMVDLYAVLDKTMQQEKLPLPHTDLALQVITQLEYNRRKKNVQHCGGTEFLLTWSYFYYDTDHIPFDYITTSGFSIYPEIVCMLVFTSLFNYAEYKKRRNILTISNGVRN